VAGSIVPVVNIPFLDKSTGEALIVDRSILSKIFMGTITHWNDEEILAQQSPTVVEKMRPVNETILLFALADGSGITEVFTKALNL
jgi:ABC-type phosphate transport system substrate-binding protein